MKIQILIYIGGITVLILFGIMLTNRITSVNISHGSVQRRFALIGSAGLAFLLILMIFRTSWLERPAVEPESTVGTIGPMLMIESRAKLMSKPYHRQRLHLVLAGMRRFADEMRKAGFEVDYRHAASFRAGLDEHRSEFRPDRILVMEPMSFSLAHQLPDLGVDVVRSNQFLCHYLEFAAWARDRKRLVMEDFYRWQRRRLRNYISPESSFY